MKVTKSSVHRLTIARDCGCTAIREYDDPRYVKPTNEGSVSLCSKHLGKSADAQEILREMILESLSQAAESAGKQYAPLRTVEVGDSGGVTASGESVQAMGVTGLPKRGEPVRSRQKRDPLSVTHVSVDRSDQRLPAKAAAASANANAMVEDGDITITGDIETVPEDPRLSGAIADELGGFEDTLDKDER